MSDESFIQESPPFTAQLNTSDTTYTKTKISLRVDESSLDQSQQQPVVSVPRLLPVSGTHCFAFSACFGSKRKSGPMGRVTVCCQNDDAKLQFDVTLGDDSHIENLTMKTPASVVVCITPSVGSSSSVEKPETIFFYAFVVHISPPVAGAIKTETIVVEKTEFLSGLEFNQKVRRPRGRPRTKKSNDSASTSSAPSSPCSEEDKPKESKKRKAEELDYRRDRTRALTDEEQAMLRLPMATPLVERLPGPSEQDVYVQRRLVSFSEIQKLYEKKYQQTAPLVESK